MLFVIVMGVAQPFTIETMPTFAKKGDVVAFFRAMLGRYGDGEKVDDDDARHLHALLKHHTDYDAKVGIGIAYFKVNINDQYTPQTRCFWIVRTDGSIDDVSFMHCITPKKS